MYTVKTEPVSDNDDDDKQKIDQPMPLRRRSNNNVEHEYMNIAFSLIDLNFTAHEGVDHIRVYRAGKAVLGMPHVDYNSLLSEPFCFNGRQSS